MEMKQLRMTADAITRFATVVLVFLSGCHGDQGATTLSERYGVCANLPPRASYRSDAPGPDFDVGILSAKNISLEVFIGGHPRFSHKVMRAGVKTTDGFNLLGKEVSDNREKLLFAYNRGGKEGPVYVMFMASDLSKVEKILTKKNLLFSCIGLKGQGYLKN
ncbi:hypothetical protein GGR62_000567 [Xanthomonas campestris]|nr:hypothetical protein [Xanthomonas sp. 3075]